MTTSAYNHTAMSDSADEPRLGQSADVIDELKTMDSHFVLNFLAGGGIWTPWAQVQCADCVDTTAEQWSGCLEETREPRCCEDNEIAAVCDDCGAVVWVDLEIALEQHMARALRAKGIPASMQQTGGMCSAVEVWAGNNLSYMLLTVAEETIGCDGIGWVLGVYDADGGFLYEADGDSGPYLTLGEALSEAQRIWASM